MMRSWKDTPGLSTAQREFVASYRGELKTYPIWYGILLSLSLIAIIGEGGRVLYPEQTPLALANVAHFIINCLVVLSVVASMIVLLAAVVASIIFTWLSDPQERQKRGFRAFRETHKKIWEGYGLTPSWVSVYRIVDKLVVVALLAVMAMGGWYVRGMLYLIAELVVLAVGAGLRQAKITYLKSLSDDDIRDILEAQQEDFVATFQRPTIPMLVARDDH